MRSLLAILCVLIALPAQAQRAFPQADYLAVYFYADWCPTCQALSPELAKAREGIGKAPVLFVTLDLTDKAKIHHSKLLAQRLGIEAFVKAQGSATGYVAVLNSETLQEVTRFDGGDAAADAIQASLLSIMNQ